LFETKQKEKQQQQQQQKQKKQQKQQQQQQQHKERKTYPIDMEQLDSKWSLGHTFLCYVLQDLFLNCVR